MSRYLKIFAMLMAVVAVVSCARPKGASKEEKIDYVQQMKKDTLAQLYSRHPEASGLIRDAEGYAVFSNINVQLLYFGSGNGYGVVVDNSTGRNTYMNMAQAGVGLGVALKDFREIIIFRNRQKLNNFITKGWDASAQGDAALKAENKGGAAAGRVYSSDVIVYQITEKGIALRTNVAGKKYWRNDELND